jgi:hypothetical protein
MSVAGLQLFLSIIYQEDKVIRKYITFIMVLMLMTFSVSGQVPEIKSPVRVQNTDSSETKNESVRNWLFSAEVLYYIVPDGQDYLWPIFCADHNRLHLEGRYNYEDIGTFSAWIGYNFSGGKKMTFEISPMAGGVIGNTRGIGLGAELSLYYYKLEFYSETEYIFNLPDPSGNFLYTWSELSFSAIDWLRLGIAVQHTKEYKTNSDLQRGFLAGVSWKKTELTGYVFDPDKSNPVIVLGINVGF